MPSASVSHVIPLGLAPHDAEQPGSYTDLPAISRAGSVWPGGPRGGVQVNIVPHRRSTEENYISPKQSSLPNRRDWYPYYAGFTEAFANAVISAHLGNRKYVLDPWSGSGTTGAACLKRGVFSKGVDVNPALTIIARARLTPLSCRPRLVSEANQILQTAKTLSVPMRSNDLLKRWMRSDAVERIRSIQEAIHLTSSECEPCSRDILHKPDHLPLVRCFYYCALFRLVRALLARFRATNPMWLKTPRSYRHRVAPSWDTLGHCFLEHVQELSGRLSFDCTSLQTDETPFETGTATSLRFEPGQFDAALTSPPYATRIDYVKGTLPELAILGADDGFLQRLRQKNTGTPVVRGVSAGHRRPLVSQSGLATLNTVEHHSSKGSRSYYLPWLRNYFDDLQAGLVEMDRTVDCLGTICVVVQDSYYKEVLIDLQSVVTEIMTDCGRPLTQRRDYAAPNARSHEKYNVEGQLQRRHHTETLLIFG